MILKYNPFSIDNIVEIEAKGPWRTKADAELSVLFSMSYDQVLSFLKYSKYELKKLPLDIRGLRSYFIRDMKKEKISGMEFHRIRKELLFGINGDFDVICEDIYRTKKKFILNPQKGIYIPQFILHTFITKEEGDILVIANTLFKPEDPRTYDTYSKEEFMKLQETYNK